MQVSVFLARLLGPLLLLPGVGLLVNPREFRTMATEVVGSITLIYLFGLFDFAAGLAIVLVHNVWTVNWRVLITLIGWLLLIRGAAHSDHRHAGGLRQDCHPQEATLSRLGRRLRNSRPRALLFWLCGLRALSLMVPDIAGKRLALLKEILPRLVRVAVLWNAASPYPAIVFKETQTAECHGSVFTVICPRFA
jgi:hypothetical protein